MASFLMPHIDRLRPDERATYVAALSEDEARAFDRQWAEWAHDGQLPPGEGWRHWVMQAGRGFGKTRAGAEWIAQAVRAAQAPLRIALVAASFDEARAVMIEGESGLLNVAADQIEAWIPTQRLLRFTGGSEARLYSGAHPAKLRGPEHHLAWCDELAKWQRGAEAWDMLQLGLRLGDNPQVLVTTTPRRCEALRRALTAAGPNVTGGATTRNPHLPPAFVDAVTGMYAGTRLARQEIDGELICDVPGALWSIELIEMCRMLPLASRHPGESRDPAQAPVQDPGFRRDDEGGFGDGPTAFVRTVIGVDPPAADGTCGIVACARDRGGVGHVLADHSVSGRSPDGWARAVAAAVEAHGAQLVVAEANQGGKMVEAVLKGARVGVPIKLVHASEGKSARADPIALLCEAGRVRFAGRFRELEAELCGLIGGGGYEGPGNSPDRADAMVWGLTELMYGVVKAAPRVRGL